MHPYERDAWSVLLVPGTNSISILDATWWFLMHSILHGLHHASFGFLDTVPASAPLSAVLGPDAPRPPLLHANKVEKQS
jgi:hypothetical protein